VQVFITTSAFRQRDAQHSPSVTMPLVRPTSDTRAVIGAAVQALAGMYRPGFNYAKAGVMLVDLRAQEQNQGELDLFTGAGEQAPALQRDRPRLMGALDALNRRFGRGAVDVASAVHQAVHSSHMARQERRSPRYTTRLNEVPTARAS